MEFHKVNAMASIQPASCELQLSGTPGIPVIVKLSCGCDCMLIHVIVLRKTSVKVALDKKCLPNK